MLSLGVVERGRLRGSVETDNVLDSIHMADGLAFTRQKPAAFVWIKFLRVSDEVFKNVLGNDEIRHGQMEQVTV